MDGCILGNSIKYLSYIIIDRHTLTSNINLVRHGSESHESADHGGEEEEDTREAAVGGGVVVTRVTERGVAQTQGVLYFDIVLASSSIHTSQVSSESAGRSLAVVRQLVAISGTVSPPPILGADDGGVEVIVYEPPLVQQATHITMSSAFFLISQMLVSITWKVLSFNAIASIAFYGSRNGDE